MRIFILASWVAVTATGISTSVFGKDRLQKEPERQESAGIIIPEYTVELRNKDGGGLIFNKHMTLVAQLTPTSKQARKITGIEFDARMPEHAHGMVTKATVKDIAGGNYEISGVRLHMLGRWVIEITLKFGDESATMTYPVELQ